MLSEIDRLIRAKEEVSLANQALKDVVWEPFSVLLENGELENARKMIATLPECPTRMLMATQLSKYEKE